MVKGSIVPKMIAALVGVSAAVAMARNLGPDPPVGRYDIKIALNDGTDPNAPPGFPMGQPLVYPELGWYSGEWVWGVQIHGYADLPAPNPGGISQWSVKCDYIYETTGPEYPTSTDYPSFTSAWTGAGRAYWTLWVPSDWDWAGTWNLPAPGIYELGFSLGINSPGTGGWMTVGTCTAMMGW